MEHNFLTPASFASLALSCFCMCTQYPPNFLEKLIMPPQGQMSRLNPEGTSQWQPVISVLMVTTVHRLHCVTVSTQEEVGEAEQNVAVASVRSPGCRGTSQRLKPIECNFPTTDEWHVLPQDKKRDTIYNKQTYLLLVVYNNFKHWEWSASSNHVHVQAPYSCTYSTCMHNTTTGHVTVCWLEATQTLVHSQGVDLY